MILRFFLTFLAFLPLPSLLEAGVWDSVSCYFQPKRVQEAPKINVLVVHDVPKIYLEVTGKYSLFDPNRRDSWGCEYHIASRLIGKRGDMTTMCDGIKWGEAFPGIFQLKITPDEANVYSLIECTPYPGSLYVYDIGRTISIVNQVTIEDYVRSTLAHFSDDQLHPEVLNAIAIIARTNAYYQTLCPKTRFWAVDAQKSGYCGLVEISPEVNQAICLSRHMVMSKTGVYEGTITPFLAQFDGLFPNLSEAVNSQITLKEANDLAQKGWHGAQILAKAFPGITILLIY